MVLQKGRKLDKIATSVCIRFWISEGQTENGNWNLDIKAIHSCIKGEGSSTLCTRGLRKHFII